jgi:hypothetical protein
MAMRLADVCEFGRDYQRYDERRSLGGSSVCLVSIQTSDRPPACYAQAKACATTELGQMFLLSRQEMYKLHGAVAQDSTSIVVVIEPVFGGDGAGDLGVEQGQDQIVSQDGIEWARVG